MPSEPVEIPAQISPVVFCCILAYKLHLHYRPGAMHYGNRRGEQLLQGVPNADFQK